MKATAASKPKTPEAKKAALLYACLLIIFAGLQLASFTGLLEVFEGFLMPGGQTFAHVLVMVIVISEIFALPFLFRLRLSPLARGISMVLGWLVSLLWLGIALWLVMAVNTASNIGLFGAMIHILPGWWMVFISLALGILAAWSSWGLWPYSRPE